MLSCLRLISETKTNKNILKVKEIAKRLSMIATEEIFIHICIYAQICIDYYFSFLSLCISLTYKQKRK